MAKFSGVLVAVAMIASLGLPACVKQRPDQYPDGTIDQAMQMSEIANTTITIHTASEPEKLSAADSLRAENQGTLVAVDGYNGPSQYAAMFKDLVIHGTPNTTYTVRFALDHQFLTAYKEVSDSSQLTAYEKGLAAQFASQISTGTKTSGKSMLRMASADISQANLIRVPVFQYPIKDYGQVDHVKNDLNEQTNILRLDHTDWGSAAYVQVSTREADRLPPVFMPGDPDTGRIFAKDQINQKVMTKQDLQSNLDFSTSDIDPSTPYYTEVDGSAMNLYRITSGKTSDMTPEQLKAINTGNAEVMIAAGVLSCTDAAQSALGAKSPNCLMSRAFEVPVTPVTAQRQQSDDGYSNFLSYVDSSDPNSGLLRIKLHPAVKKVMGIDAGDLMDPSKTLIVDKMKDKEFLMTRTLKDSPSSFGEMFLGNAGKLEIVRFLFEEDRVRVVRSRPRVQHLASNSNDLDTMISLPAQYAVLASVDDDGTRLATPKKKDAYYNTPGAIAIVDWTKNEMPEINSPLDYYELDQCFDGEQEKEISEVNNQPDQGILGFTYSRTYQGSRTQDCAGVFMNSDYFAKYPQTNFRFEERISFREYDSSHDKNVILDMPYEVQQQLGFGTFTYPVVTADQYGDVNKKGSQQNLAMLWDLKNGKKVTYVLAGLPEKGQIQGGVTRQDIIDAARSVFKDLNVAMHKALKGSPLERPEDQDILELKIEGDDAPKGELGDIQRNTIYWVQKQLDSPIWGLAQAQPNPRSGMIETANVFVYGGNFLSSVPAMKERAYWEKHYAEIQASTQGSQGQDSLADKLKNIETGNLPDAPSSSQAPGPQQKMMMEIANLMPSAGLPDIRQMIASNPNLVKTPSRISDKNKLFDLSNSNLQPLLLDQRYSKAIALQHVLEQARTTGAFNEPSKLESLVDANLQDILGGTLDVQSSSAIKAMAGHAKLKAKVMERLQQMGVCVYDRSEMGSLSANSNVDVLKWTDREWVLNIFKPTLAHEVGHTLGLRHNFQGSYDKANWYFAGMDQKKRTYSSIMDYMVDDHISYDGLGPYDVAALRAAYTGRVELEDGSLVSFDDVKKAAGAEDWFKFKSVDTSALKVNGKTLRHYDFCSDEDTDGDPTCRRFDHGTTPLEIVNYDINEYKALYPVRNLPLDKPSFSYYGTGPYMSGLFGRMIELRKMLEETIYQSIRGADKNTVDSFLNAANRVMLFFHEIVRTPDSPAFAATTDARFVPVQDSKGNTLMIERKALSDLGLPNDKSSELQVRGIEMDKVVATMMLTERSFGIPRYLRQSIQISFPELERMIGGGDPTKSLTLSLLQEILTDRVTPIAWADGPVPLPGAFHASITDTIRFYAVMSAMVSLNTDTINQDYDPSSLFRVLGTSSVPHGISGAIMPGSLGNKEGNLIYWAPSGAPMADQMIRGANGIEKALSVQSKLMPLLDQWIALKLGIKLGDQSSSQPSQDVSTTPNGNEASGSSVSLGSGSAELEKQINKILTTLPPESGSTQDSSGKLHALTAKDLGAELDQLISRYATFNKLGKLAQSSGDQNDVRQYLETLEAFRNETTSDVLGTPAFGVLISAFDPSSGSRLPEISGMSQIMPSSSLLLDTEGMIVSNAKNLDEMLVAIHPEVLREYK